MLTLPLRTSLDCAHAGESDQDSTRALMPFLPHLLAQSSKSKPLLRLLRSKEFMSFLFNSHSPEEIDGVKQSITEYQKVGSRIGQRVVYVDYSCRDSVGGDHSSERYMPQLVHSTCKDEHTFVEN